MRIYVGCDGGNLGIEEFRNWWNSIYVYNPLLEWITNEKA
jgi:hypothetical protein